MERKLYKVYCCFYGGGSLNQVFVKDHIGELRLDKGHPRLYFERLKRSCIGLECMNKIMFKTEAEAEKQAQILNSKRITSFEWEKWVREMKERKHWLTSGQVKELNLEEIEVEEMDEYLHYILVPLPFQNAKIVPDGVVVTICNGENKDEK